MKRAVEIEPQYPSRSVATVKGQRIRERLNVTELDC